MRKQLYTSLVISVLLGFTDCSSSSSNNKNQGATTDSTSANTESLNAAAPPPAACQGPNEVELTNAVYNAKENYTLTYSWTSVPNASKYSFSFYLNGTVAYSDTNVSGTSITFTQAIPANNKMHAEVITNCTDGSSSSPKASFEATYFNSVAETDIIMLAKPSDSVNDICAKNCDKLKFTGSSILNTDGTVINLSTYSSKIYYLDFAMVEQCINCNGNVAAQKVDPVAFNSCLADPGNDYALYDPDKYTVCP